MLKQKIAGSHGHFQHKLQDPIINSEERWRWGEVWGLPSESNRALDENLEMNRLVELEPLFCGTDSVGCFENSCY